MKHGKIYTVSNVQLGFRIPSEELKLLDSVIAAAIAKSFRIPSEELKLQRRIYSIKKDMMF